MSIISNIHIQFWFNWLAWLPAWSEVQMVCIWSSWCHCHPIISCFIKIQNGLTFLVPAYRVVLKNSLLNGWQNFENQPSFGRLLSMAQWHLLWPTMQNVPLFCAILYRWHHTDRLRACSKSSVMRVGSSCRWNHINSFVWNRHDFSFSVFAAMYCAFVPWNAKQLSAFSRRPW